MNPNQTVTSHASGSVVEHNKLLRNTYTLLAMTLIWSGVAAGIAMVMNLPRFGLIITLVGFFGLIYLTERLKNTSWGILAVFALTGFMGATLGPMLNSLLSSANGGQVVMTALVGTGAIFLGLSAYVLVTKKDFSFMGGFLMVGILVAFLAGLGAIVFSIPGLSLAVSAMFILLMSGLILYQTSQLINGGETNYISATVGLYVSIYNLFTSLLMLLGIMSSND